jgi:hypothetical protein
MEVHMIRRRLGLTAIWAGGTFALAMALGLPATSNAVDYAGFPGMTATILTPRLTVNGVQLTATPETAATTQPSQTARDSKDRQLKIEVRAENKTAASASGSFSVMLMSTSPNSWMSRTLSMPSLFWKDSGDFTLAAGESKTISFAAPPLTPNRLFTVYLASSGNKVAVHSMVAQNP